ncbi:SH3 domain-containing protein [Cellulophaga sp. 20_2_10]|uniref:SH3 domain-containing protein n=1 Tax=Cellulophaga sp. 20_2_10 TaxID=2942476 RepID=UPI00201A97F0|nr:SH3 domain-containing protein [Cellulophaga sp. 20_2_10]MCL5247474.1 SH3 domain-containing protein [Cellulophaga sp. 20_2_10]
MKNLISILALVVCFSSLAQNNHLTTGNSENLNELFSAYTTAENGLNYRKEPNINSEILGTFNYGTKVAIVENKDRSLFWIDDQKRGSLYGKWVGVKKDSSVVYAFNAYLYKSSPEIENKIKIIDGKLEVIHNEVRNIDSNNHITIEMHIQTSNHLANYVLVKLETTNKIVYTHKIKHLFKENYELKRTKDTNPIFEYFTLFDECPSQEYKETFTIRKNKIIKISDYYNEADEE